uniref:Uncharacterized protein n=1 Tax=Arundo donax TaxID=35708 RepID=A0A0A9BUH8_ARUDO
MDGSKVTKLRHHVRRGTHVEEPIGATRQGRLAGHVVQCLDQGTLVPRRGRLAC